MREELAYKKKIYAQNKVLMIKNLAKFMPGKDSKGRKDTDHPSTIGEEPIETIPAPLRDGADSGFSNNFTKGTK